MDSCVIIAAVAVVVVIVFVTVVGWMNGTPLPTAGGPGAINFVLDLTTIGVPCMLVQCTCTVHCHINLKLTYW